MEKVLECLRCLSPNPLGLFSDENYSRRGWCLVRPKPKDFRQPIKPNLCTCSTDECPREIITEAEGICVGLQEIQCLAWCELVVRMG
jgi:hypothetical protein